MYLEEESRFDYEEASKLFDELDIEAEGVLDHVELKYLMLHFVKSFKPNRRQITEEEVDRQSKRMIREMNVDGEGSVRFENFKEYYEGRRVAYEKDFLLWQARASWKFADEKKRSKEEALKAGALSQAVVEKNNAKHVTERLEETIWYTDSKTGKAHFLSELAAEDRLKTVILMQDRWDAEEAQWDLEETGWVEEMKQYGFQAGVGEEAGWREPTWAVTKRVKREQLIKSRKEKRAARDKLLEEMENGTIDDANSVAKAKEGLDKSRRQLLEQMSRYSDEVIANDSPCASPVEAAEGRSKAAKEEMTLAGINPDKDEGLIRVTVRLHGREELHDDGEEVQVYFGVDDAIEASIKDYFGINFGSLEIIHRGMPLSGGTFEENEVEDGGYMQVRHGASEVSLDEIVEDLFDLNPHCKYERLKDGITRNRDGTLQGWDLKRRGIQVLPESIGGVRLSGNLILNHNKLTALPESLAALHVGGEINLECNQLECLPESIGLLKLGARLNLAGNNITYIPPSMSDIKCKVIDLSGNPLGDEAKVLIAAGFNNCGKLICDY